MPTTIAPSLGNDALFTQGGAGTSPGYDAIDLRRFMSASLQEGVIDSGSYRVTERAAGVNMSADIAASTGDGAYIEGDAVASQGLYHVPPHSALINETITGADATNPRIDQIVVEQLDDTHDSTGSNLQRTRVVAGTPTAGATLDNRSGAASLPSSALRLADVLVGAGVTSITTANIRDRRAWAKGAHFDFRRDTGNISAPTVSTVLREIFIECSGPPLELGLFFSASNGTALADLFGAIQVDGVGVLAADGSISGAGRFAHISLRGPYTPSPGYRRITWRYHNTRGDTTIFSNTSEPMVAELREVLAQDATNG